MENTAKLNTVNTAGLFPQWAIVTVLLAASLSILSAHSMYFYPLLLLIGFATGIGQWWLLRQRMERIWSWILASTLGWVGGFLLTAGIVYVIGYINLLVDFGVYMLYTLQIIVYPVALGIMAAAQGVILHRRGYNSRTWVLMGVAAGFALSLAQIGTCAAGGGAMFTQLIGSDAMTDAICVNIGVTIPRLQTAEPFFNVAPLSFAAHVMGWLAYALVSAYGINRLLTEPREA
ncbi:MAG: hypothetical protein AAFV33_08320 [Chloroflexota bacterium]